MTLRNDLILHELVGCELSRVGKDLPECSGASSPKEALEAFGFDDMLRTLSRTVELVSFVKLHVALH